MSRTEEELRARAAELDCHPEFVPVIERLDIIIALLRHMPLTYGRFVMGSTDSLLRDLFPGYKPPTS